MTKSFMNSLVAVLPFICFADDWSHGCYYDNNDNAVICPPDAPPVDVCEGNKYVISQELQSMTMNIYGASSAVENTLTNLQNQYNAEWCYTNFVCYETTWNHIQTLQPAQTEFIYMLDAISRLNNVVEKYDCSSCSGTVVTNDPNGGTTVIITNQCCDFSSILYRLDSLNNVVSNRIYNILLQIREQLDYTGDYADGFEYMNAQLMHLGYGYGVSYTPLYSFYPGLDPLIRDMLESLLYNQSEMGSSLNNYFYQLNHQIFPEYVSHVTNFFSLFQGEAVLSDYWKFPSSVRREVSYYQFLTNHYIAVSQGEQFYDYQGVSVEITKTNWMDRIEALIAAIVFNDGGAVSNTVNIHYEQEDPDGLIQTMSEAFTDLENDPQSALSALRDTSQSLVSSISRFSSAFHDASMPGTVRLVNFGASSPSNRSADSSAGSSDSVEFSTSDGSTFFEMCRCATTIAWTLCGLILVVVFLSWASKTSYKMFIFCWDVFNGIFGK